MDIAEALSRTLLAEGGTRPVRAIEALAAPAMNRVRALMPRPERVPGAAPFARGGHARLPELGARELLAAFRDPFLLPTRNPRHPAHGLILSPPPGYGALAVCRRVAAPALVAA
ncbi:hypothetical protein ACFQX4_13960 [Roseomonas sp. GCM10028921]